MHSAQPPHQLSQSITRDLLQLATMYQIDNPLAINANDGQLPDITAEQRVLSDQAHSSKPPAAQTGSTPSMVIVGSAPAAVAPPMYHTLNSVISSANQETVTIPQPPASDSVSIPLAFSTLNLDEHGLPLTYSSARAWPNTVHWQAAEAEELDRLIQTATIRPIHYSDQPVARRTDTTYYNPQTKEIEDSAGLKTYKIRGTIGGDRINYPGPTTAHTAAMPLVKMLIHSVISDNAQWIALDIKDFYLNTPLERPEYLRISAKYIPACTVTKHRLDQFLHNNTVLFEVNKGMYGLPQAGLLAQQRLVTHLAVHGCNQTQTTCLFRHIDNGTVFSLVVDDFGVKYTSTAGAQHLIITVQMLYPITVDWTGCKYLGFSIHFDRAGRTVALSMPGYIAKVLKRFAPTLTTGADSPSIYVPHAYGATAQTPTTDNSAPLPAPAKTRLQELIGSLLYYARGVDVTILPTVTLLASLQANPTEYVLQASNRLLAYCARHPNNSLLYRACDMILHIQSDASYLSRPGARSIAGGIFYLGNRNQPTHINGSIHALSTIIPSVVASAAEAEYAALFLNGQEGEWIRNTLHSLGYLQPPTIILCDNKCAEGIATDTVKAKRTKSIKIWCSGMNGREMIKWTMVS